MSLSSNGLNKESVMFEFSAGDVVEVLFDTEVLRDGVCCSVLAGSVCRVKFWMCGDSWAVEDDGGSFLLSRSAFKLLMCDSDLPKFGVGERVFLSVPFAGWVVGSECWVVSVFDGGFYGVRFGQDDVVYWISGGKLSAGESVPEFSAGDVVELLEDVNCMSGPLGSLKSCVLSKGSFFRVKFFMSGDDWAVEDFDGFGFVISRDKLKLVDNDFPKFKLGDRVQLLESVGGVGKGTVCVIWKVGSGSSVFWVAGGDRMFWVPGSILGAFEGKIVEEFKPGDLVELVGGVEFTDVSGKRHVLAEGSRCRVNFLFSPRGNSSMSESHLSVEISGQKYVIPCSKFRMVDSSCEEVPVREFKRGDVVELVEGYVELIGRYGDFKAGERFVVSDFSNRVVCEFGDFFTDEWFVVFHSIDGDVDKKYLVPESKLVRAGEGARVKKEVPVEEFKVGDRVKLVKEHNGLWVGCDLYVFAVYADGDYGVEWAGSERSYFVPGSKLELFEKPKATKEDHKDKSSLVWEYSAGLGEWYAKSEVGVENFWRIEVIEDGAFGFNPSDIDLYRLLPQSRPYFESLREAKLLAEEVEAREVEKRKEFLGARESLRDWENADAIDLESQEILEYVRFLENEVNILKGSKNV